MGDVLVHAVALDGHVRVVATQATATVEELRFLHDPSPVVCVALSRVVVGSVLLAALLEKVTHREPLLTVEVTGNGPVSRLVATASPAGWVRAYPANPHAVVGSVTDDVTAIIGAHPELVVTRDAGHGNPYRGVVPMIPGKIAETFARYLDTSEQSPAAVLLAETLAASGRVTGAGGIIIQLLPGVSDAQADALERQVHRFGSLSEALTRGHDTPHAWLDRLFPRGFEVLGKTPLRFLCGCSGERVERALLLLGIHEIHTLLLQQQAGQPVSLTCEFCRRQYSVSEQRLAHLLLELTEEPSRPQ